MATVIDSLVVEVGLDPSRFAEGRRQVDQEVAQGKKTLEDFGRNVERGGQKISQIFGLTKNGVAGIIATFVGGEAAQFIAHVANMDAHTSRLAHSIGETTRELSIWQNMVRMVGGDAGEANAAFAGLNDIFQQMKMGNVVPPAPFASLLSRAGIDFRTASPHQALMQMMTYLSSQTPQDQRFWLQQVPGLQGNEHMIFLMLEGLKNMAKFRAEIERLGPASEASGEAARDLQEKTAQLQTAWEGFARVLFPTLTGILDWINSVFTSKAGPWIASMVGGAAVGATVGSIVPGVGTGIGALAGAAAGAITYGTSGASSPGGAPGGLPTGGAAPSAAGAGGGTRGDRNNNPGNIEYGAWALAHGATGSDGRFAIFPTRAAGLAAMAQLLHDRYQGLTLAQIQQRWVGNQDTGYLGSMMQATGLSAGDIPNLNDNEAVANLMRGMMRGEGTGRITPRASNTSNKTSSVTIGSINVASSKADPGAVADEIPESIKRYTMLGGINTGLA